MRLKLNELLDALVDKADAFRGVVGDDNVAAYYTQTANEARADYMKAITAMRDVINKTCNRDLHACKSSN